MSVKRFDASIINGTQRTPQGGLRVPACPTRAGVFLYRNADGTERRELRHPSQVFKPESLATLRSATVTEMHPTQGPVTPDNWRGLTVGHVSEDVRQDGSHVSAPLLIQHADTIRKIESGELKELSCGYSCNIDATPGLFEGERYDVQQTDIEYNHVAVGPEGWGRGGSTVSLRLDAGDAVEIHKTVSNGREGKRMKTIRIDGIEYEPGSDAFYQAMVKHDSAAEVKNAEQTAMIGRLTSEKETAIKRADASDKEAKEAKEALVKGTDPKAIHALAKSRADMIDKCRTAHKLSGVKFDAAATETSSESGMMLEALKAMAPEFDPEGKDPGFIQGYFMAQLAALLKEKGATTEEEEETTTDTEETDPATDPTTAGVASPPGAPGRADSRSVHGARGVASREDGKGASKQRTDANTPDAAEQRMRTDSAQAWQEPLHFSK